MARARVEFRVGSSFNMTGRPSFRKAEVKVLTNLNDIKFFETQGDFRVTWLEEPKVEKVNEPDEVDQDGDDEEETDDAPALPEWKPTDNKATLIAAASARDLAVTDEDKKADIIELLQAWDDDQQA